MTHTMKLQPDYYNYILKGTKRIELRLNDEKRKNIKIGDTITFLKEPDLTESFETKVTGLLNYATFSDLFDDFDISILSDSSMTKLELLNVLQKFYTEDMQSKYGVLGIRFKL